MERSAGGVGETSRINRFTQLRRLASPPFSCALIHHLNLDEALGRIRAAKGFRDLAQASVMGPKGKRSQQGRSEKMGVNKPDSQTHELLVFNQVVDLSVERMRGGRKAAEIDQGLLPHG